MEELLMKKDISKTIKLISIFAFVLLAMSCTSTKLYSWYDYQEDYYHFQKEADKDSLDDLIKTYQKIIDNQKETRGIVPPGIYADYGWLLAQSGKVKEAKEMLAKEIELYPESEVFVGSILKRLGK